jgi:disulfide bond formation protein DsbB
MGSIGKRVSLLLVVILAVSSLIVVESAFAQTPTPSIPTFTVQLVGPPYIHPTTYQLDQSTGQIVANIGYSNEYSAVELTIKNQPLVFDYSNVHLIGAFGFYYNIQIKPHSSSGDWIDIYHAWDYGYGVPSNSEYTNLSFSIEGQMGVGVLAGTQLDIQVQAMIGSIGRQYNPNASSPIGMYPYVFSGETSAWSSTQTISIPANFPLSANSPSPTSSLNPTAASTSMPTTTNPTGNSISVPLSILIVVVAVFLAIIVALSLLLFRRHQKTISQNKLNV